MKRIQWMRVKRVAVVAAVFLCTALLAVAQTNTADIVGTVTDATGAVIPGAKVTVVNVGTGQRRTGEANSAGEYAFSLLQVGNYSVEVAAPGFAAFRVASLTLSAGDRTRVDAHLEPGNVQQTVQVVTATPELQTDTSSVGALVEDAQVQDLPLNGRNFINLVQVQAGVTPGLSGSFGGGGKPDDRRETSSYSANGQTDQANNNMIDGFDNNDRLIGIIGVRPSPDAIQEVKVLTGNYTAEVGRSAGGVVDIITKSGTNDLHGSLYEYFRNDKLDAQNYFALPGEKPELRQNQFGGSLGGPIRKDKTFFFGDYEGFRQVSGQTIVSTVPTKYEETHCSAEAGCDFTDTGGPYVPSVLLNSIGMAYFQLFPAPTSSAAFNNFVYSPNATQFSNLFDVRIDQHMSERDTLSGRYSFNNVNTVLPGPFPDVDGVQPGGGTYVFAGPSAERQMQLGLTWTHIFSPTLLGELKAGYMRNNIATQSANKGLTPASAIGYTGVNVAGIPATDGLPSFTLGGGYEGLGDSAFQPEFELDNSFQYMGDVIYSHGNHNIKIGAGLIRRQASNGQSLFPRGAGFMIGSVACGIFNPDPENPYLCYSIANEYVLADLVMGQAESIERQTSLVAPSFRSWEPSAYVQDDWRVNRALTLNLGVRWDVFTPYTAHNNAISNFDFSNDLIVGPGLTGANHSSATAGLNTFYGDVSPRVGFAIDLGHATVVRGGFGISTFPDNFTLQSFLKNPPYAASFQCGIITAAPNAPTCISVNPAYAGIIAVNYGLGSEPAPVFDVTQATNPANYAGGLFYAMDFKFKPSYIEQYSLAVEKDMGGNVIGVGYVGNLGRRIVGYPNLNQAPYPGAPTPIPSLASTIISTGVSAGVSSYNALQLTVERRLAKGLSGNVNYTLAHSLSDIVTNGEGASNIPNGDRFSCVGECHVNIPGTQNYKTVNSWEVYDYGNSELDVRQRVALTLGYEIPAASSLSGAAGILLKGWTTNVLYFYQTGLPFTVENDVPVGGTADGFTNSNDRPDVVGPTRASSFSVQQYFNTASFETQPGGQLGNEGKNPIYAPRVTALNFSLFKTFAIKERMKLQLRAESFNLTNTPSFNPPDNMLGDAQFGVISSTIPGATPRQIQFAAKLLF